VTSVRGHIFIYGPDRLPIEQINNTTGTVSRTGFHGACDVTLVSRPLSRAGMSALRQRVGHAEAVSLTHDGQLLHFDSAVVRASISLSKLRLMSTGSPNPPLASSVTKPCSAERNVRAASIASSLCSR
jgi:hypothetical protein